MRKIPNDLSEILLEIDAELKAQGVKQHARPIQAVRAFSKRFSISMPLTDQLITGAPRELKVASKYTREIYRWYDDMYGDALKVDFSERAKIGVLADGDMWEMRIPKVFGLVVVEETREMSEPTITTGVIRVNPCCSLVGLTEGRLSRFADADLNEIYQLYVIGLDVRAAFDRFRSAHPMFAEAESDWAAAAMHLTAQTPNYGQSRWASLQLCEKFMKGLIAIIGDEKVERTHKLSSLHDALRKSVPSLNLHHLLSDVECIAAVRYGEVPSSRMEAYASHKSSLLLVRSLGSIRNANDR